MQSVTYVSAVEMLGSQEHRAYFAGMFEMCWSLGIMTLAGIAYWLRDWRWIQLGITVPSIIGSIYVWYEAFGVYLSHSLGYKFLGT